MFSSFIILFFLVHLTNYFSKILDLCLVFFSTVAKTLANVANEHSRDTSFDSPYSLEARGRVRSVKHFKILLSI